MTSISLSVIIAALVVVGTEDMGSGHTVFANRGTNGHTAFTNRGINVPTDTNQDQGCEQAGGTSGTTNACTATSTIAAAITIDSRIALNNLVTGTVSKVPVLREAKTMFTLASVLLFSIIIL